MKKRPIFLSILFLICHCVQVDANPRAGAFATTVCNIRTSTVNSTQSEKSVNISESASQFLRPHFKAISSNESSVELENFSASASANHQVFLEWKVQQEVNISGYYIEKSIDGIHFSKVGDENAYGNNSTVAAYRWDDTNPLNGKNFYRLKIVDFAGKFTYSPVVFASISVKNSINILPNPIEKNTVQLLMSGSDKGSYQLGIYSAAGQQMSQHNFQYDGMAIQKPIVITKPLPQAVYSVVITNPTGNKKVMQIIVGGL